MTKNYNDYKYSSARTGFIMTTKNCQNLTVINTNTYTISFDTDDKKTILIT